MLWLVTVTTVDRAAYGTGFFFHFCEQYFDCPAPALVTNKHVLKDARRISFPLNLGDNGVSPLQGQFEVVDAAIEKCAVIEHPCPEVDLCAILLGPFMDAVKGKAGRQTGLVCATPDSVATVSEVEALRPLDPVVMIGYPVGLWDDKNNQPISRRGALATRPSLNFQGRPEFLIDLACFPGSSGSPVYIHDVLYVAQDDRIDFGKGRTRLLGVLYAVPMYDAEGKLKPTPVPTSGVSIRTKMPIHLGYVLKAQEVLALNDPIRDFVRGVRGTTRR